MCVVVSSCDAGEIMDGFDEKRREKTEIGDPDEQQSNVSSILAKPKISTDSTYKIYTIRAPRTKDSKADLCTISTKGLSCREDLNRCH